MLKAKWLCVLAFLLGPCLDSAIASAGHPGWDNHMEWSAQAEDSLALRAAEFLFAHAPESDHYLTAEFLNENLDLALRARAEFAWAARVPESMFLNDVLPYASLDETRERWRPALYAMSKQIVREAQTAGEAAQLLNQQLFNVVGVHYNTGRKRPNQSPFESMKHGRATCTGLSILLVNACRSVGVPARIAGVAEWVSTPGNHTWVEIWDGERWRFLGADEFDAKGLDRAWFVGRAREAIRGDENHAVWASSWKPTGNHFPMAWDRASTSVHAVDVTQRYAPIAEHPDTSPDTVTRFFRVWDTEGGIRIAAHLTAQVDADPARVHLRTKAGRADLNDMPSAELPANTRAFFDLSTGDLACRVVIDTGSDESAIVDLYLDQLMLTSADADLHAAEFAATRARSIQIDRADEIERSAITLGEHTLKYAVRTIGDEPEGGRSLWISLHGGGGAPAEVNDSQWQNQIRLYTPEEGIYVAPRAPTDTWNLWHQGHIDGLFDRLIENMVAQHGVNPDRVYLLGYSAGGDGVYQLAPRMADRFAAASMMAGHPNEARPLGLRNLPFAIFMGSEDAAFDRNTVAERWGDELEALQADDPSGYPHRVTIYEGLGHWMQRRDAEALPWMQQYTRRIWPDRVVWFQDDVVQRRFYWLSVDAEDAVAGTLVRASVSGQTITITADTPPASLTLRLHDRLLDLDEPVRVILNGEQAFSGRVLRTRGAIESSLMERLDAPGASTAVLRLNQHESKQ